MRRNRLPGTRNPLSWPESKQRMIVCWLTLQILAASPVVNTVFIFAIPLSSVKISWIQRSPRANAGQNPRSF